MLVVTYASAPNVNKAAHSAGVHFDLAIADEAHRTAGRADKDWGLVVRSEFRARRRLFMTATPRFVAVPDERNDPVSDGAAVLSMDGSAYGAHFVPLTFRDAIDEDYLSPYRVAVVGIKSSAARELVRKVARTACAADYTASDAAAHLALAQITRQYPHMRSVLAYHNRVPSSMLWSERLEAVYRSVADGDPQLSEVPLRTWHMDATTRGVDREMMLGFLRNPGKELAVVSNCHVLAEGVNVPALDAVIFAAPRSSTPDIVQIVGRAMRRVLDEHGRVVRRPPALAIVPVVIDDNEIDDVDSAVARSSHRAAWRVLASLAIEDVQLQHALVDWGDSVNSGRPFYSDVLSVDLPHDLGSHASDVIVRTIKETTSSVVRTARWVSRYYDTVGDLDFRRRGGCQTSSVRVSCFRRPSERCAAGGRRKSFRWT